MQLDYLHEFLDLANTLNFTKSASNMHISQSTLSRHIAELEKELGTRLFDRTTNSVKLTRAGMAFYDKSSTMVNDYEDIVHELKQTVLGTKDVIRVGGSTIQPTVNRLFTKLSSRASREELPVKIEYCPTRSFSGESPSPYSADLLLAGDVDLVIEPLPRNSEYFHTCEAVELCDEELLVFASKDNPLAREKNLRLEDLEGSNLTTFAIYKLCPALMSEPFRNAGFGTDRIRTSFIGDLLEVPEHLASLGKNQIAPLQKFFCHSFGFGQDGTGETVELDIVDEHAKVTFWALYRKNEENPAVAQIVGLLERILDDYTKSAAPESFNSSGNIWSSVFYNR